MKIKVRLFLKIYMVLTVGLSALAIIFISFFLYQYLYQAITQASIIYNLKLELAVQPVDTDLFNQIETRLNAKQNPPAIDWQTVKNPFLPIAPPPAKKTPNKILKNIPSN